MYHEWYDYYAKYIAPVLEIGVLSILIYYIFLSIDKISAGGKIKGMAMIVFAIAVLNLAAYAARLYAITELLTGLLKASPLILAIIFQPELRRLFLRMASIFATQENLANASVIDRTIEAVTLLSKSKIGALIVYERNDHLDNYVLAGPFDCGVSVRAFQTIFWKNAPVHDGATIVRDGRIVAAGVILPLTQNQSFKTLSGTRHRAAIGISEDTDAIAIVVSEETGKISLAISGDISIDIERDELAEILHKEMGAGRRMTGSGERVVTTTRTAKKTVS